jgi:hypothetical protein
MAFIQTNTLSLEIPFVDQEQEDAVRILPDNEKEERVLQGEKGVEISLTIKLPTANINLPRDLSKQELSVPKSIRLNESHEPKNVNEIEPMLIGKYIQLLCWISTGEVGGSTDLIINESSLLVSSER